MSTENEIRINYLITNKNKRLVGKERTATEQKIELAPSSRCGTIQPYHFYIRLIKKKKTEIVRYILTPIP